MTDAEAAMIQGMFEVRRLALRALPPHGDGLMLPEPVLKFLDAAAAAARADIERRRRVREYVTSAIALTIMFASLFSGCAFVVALSQ